MDSKKKSTLIASFTGLPLVYMLAIMSWSALNYINQSYWSFFMTDVAMIGTGTMAVILIVSKVVDFASIPLVGIIIERVKLPWGKLRSWVLVAPIWLTVCFFFMFMIYPFETAVNGVLLCMAYCLAAFGINTLITAQNSVTQMAPRSAEERAMFATKKGQASALASFLTGLIMLPVILFFNGGDRAGSNIGYLAAVAVFGGLCIAVHLVLFRLYPVESVVDEGSGARIEKNADVGKMFKIFFTTPPVLGIVLADGFRYLAWMSITGAIAFYASYYLGDMAWVSVFFSLSGVAAIIGALLSQFIVRFVDKWVLYLVGLVGLMTIMIACFLFVNGDGMTFIVLMSVGFLFVSFINSTQLGLYADAVDYGVYLHKSDVRGILMAMLGFAPKIGILLSGVVVGVGLSVIGYDAADVTAEAIAGLPFVMLLIPACCLAVGVAILLATNRLTNDKMVPVRAFLTEAGLLQGDPVTSDSSDRDNLRSERLEGDGLL
ncbi:MULTISPECIES: MFS transporter [unclassified Adlercreutzia]|uniref:MFS transporter n=1 Tax=unclassified Adlercreutzia TaxID=2636013 RepID=UPI0013ED6175|nr:MULTISPECIES: MFS transporter [unclassified Adlercreutzia]